MWSPTYSMHLRDLDLRLTQLQWPGLTSISASQLRYKIAGRWPCPPEASAPGGATAPDMKGYRPACLRHRPSGTLRCRRLRWCRAPGRRVAAWLAGSSDPAQTGPGTSAHAFFLRPLGGRNRKSLSSSPQLWKARVLSTSIGHGMGAMAPETRYGLGHSILAVPGSWQFSSDL